MAVHRLRRPPLAVPADKGETLYEVQLSGSPSAAWRAAFLRPPARLTSVRGTLELGRLELVGARCRDVDSGSDCSGRLKRRPRRSPPEESPA
jgi:hypothetical protein